MELSHEEEVEIPMPINSAYVGFQGYHHGSMAHHSYHHHHHHHNHDPSSSSSTQNQHNNNIILPSNNSNGTTTNSTITTTTATTAVVTDEDDDRSLLGQNHSHCNNDDNNNGNNDDNSSAKAMKKKEMMMMVTYKECQKNHAACMGGNARDGCGEFMPSSGEEGSIESLICSVCNCHRNFHRKEFQGEHNMNMNMVIPTYNSSYSPFYPSTTPPHFLNNKGRKVILGGNGVGYPTISGQFVPRSLGVNNMTACDNHNHNQEVKKRFRTRFSQEQKEKMLEFAEKVGWKIQRQEENVVQQFCQQIGIKRRVLKVWMHNNKHSFAKKNDMIIDNNDINNSS